MRYMIFEKHTFGYFCRKKYILLLIDKGNQSEKLRKHLSSYIAPKF